MQRRHSGGNKRKRIELLLPNQFLLFDASIPSGRDRGAVVDARDLFQPPRQPESASPQFPCPCSLAARRHRRISPCFIKWSFMMSTESISALSKPPSDGSVACRCPLDRVRKFARVDIRFLSPIYWNVLHSFLHLPIRYCSIIIPWAANKGTVSHSLTYCLSRHVPVYNYLFVALLTL